MLVTMKEILDHAKKGGYGVTAPNVQSEDTVRAVLEVAEKYRAPMIVCQCIYSYGSPLVYTYDTRSCRKGISTCCYKSGSWKIL